MPELTATQRAAVEHGEGNLQIIACAGSGKTEVVAQRVAFLLDPNTSPSLKPNQIVAFTFTNKAASELKQRIVRRVLERMPQAHGLSDLFVGTIHGYCLDLLQQHDSTIRQFTVLSDIQQKLLIQRFSSQSGLTQSTDLRGRGLRRNQHDAARYAQAMSILREDDVDWDLLDDCSVAQHLRAYEDLLERERYLDYSAVLSRAVALLERDQQARTELAGTLRYLIVDEYQDVNPIQERLIRALHEAGAALCVVGDQDQAIYQWRGASSQHIQQASTRYDNLTRIELSLNFRSSHKVIDTAKEIIPERGDRTPTEMLCAGVQEYEDGDVTSHRFETKNAEADWIAESCKQHLGVAISDGGTKRGLAWPDMAVLLRAKVDIEPILEAFERKGVPHVVVGSKGLFSTPEAQALVMLYHFLHGDRIPVDEDDVYPPTQTDVVTAWTTLAPGLSTELLFSALDNRPARPTSLQEILHRFLHEAGIHEDSLPQERAERIMFNIGRFSSLTEEFEAIWRYADERLKEFVCFLYLQAPNEYAEGIVDAPMFVPDAVQVMTIHQAKGMEWAAVFVPALAKNRFPAGNVGGPDVWDLIPKEAIASSERYLTIVEDERRLFYVAVTRSKKFLHLSFAPGERGFQEPSGFLSIDLGLTWKSDSHFDRTGRRILPPQVPQDVGQVEISFSDLKHYLECPYQYKLKTQYGFEAEPNEAQGYGSGLHSALAEIHNLARRGKNPFEIDIHDLVRRHLYLRLAPSPIHRKLFQYAKRAIERYLDARGDELHGIELVEKNVESRPADLVTLRGRIDFVRRSETQEVTIVDIKSSARSQADEISELQLQTYALGYQELRGQAPDKVEIFDMEEGVPSFVRDIDQAFMDGIRRKAVQAGESIRRRRLQPEPESEKCQSCELRRACSAGARTLGEPAR